MSADHLLLDVARPLLPPTPSLPPEERRQVERDLEDFLGAQVEGMPLHLRLPLRLALLGFRWLPVLRYGRPYHALPAAAQSRVVRAWDGSRFGPARDLVRLVKSLALFFYLDHPAVLARLEARGGGAADAD